MAETDLKVWYNSIPRITRFWFTLLVVFPVASRLGLVSPKWLVLDWNLVVNQFQIWRLVTCALWLPTSFNYLVILYFVYTYSYGLEAGYFSGRPAEYVYLLLFSLINCVICGLLFEFPILMPMTMFVVLYIWCMINPDEIVSFWFGTKFKVLINHIFQSIQQTFLLRQSFSRGLCLHLTSSSAEECLIFYVE